MGRRETGLPSLLGQGVVPAIALLVLLSFAFIAGLLLQVARHLDAHAAEQTAVFARAALDRRFEASGKEIKDYAAWGEAYQNLHLTTDVAWAFERRNIGSTLYKDFGYDDVFVVGPGGTVTYAVVRGQWTGTEAGEPILGGLDSLVQRARDVAPGETKPVTGLLQRDGQPVIAAAAAISTGGDPTIRVTPGPPSVLVFARVLEPGQLAEIGTKAFVQGLRAVLPAADIRAADSLTLMTEDGSIPITLRWDPERPGQLLLTRVLPWLCLGACGFALLAVLIIRRMVQTARLIELKALALAEAHRRAEYAAEHDSVTGLPNRMMLRRHLDAALGPGAENGQTTILFIDLDRFKAINDTLGHRAGDEVLQQTARRLRTLVREGDIVARVGGDEFVLVLKDQRPRAEVEQLCRQLFTCIGKPMRVEERSVSVGLSVGVAMAPADARSADDLMKRADLAMYRAKRQGGAAFRFFADDAPADVTSMMAVKPRNAALAQA